MDHAKLEEKKDLLRNLKSDPNSSVTEAFNVLIQCVELALESLDRRFIEPNIEILELKHENESLRRLFSDMSRFFDNFKEEQAEDHSEITENIWKIQEIISFHKLDKIPIKYRRFLPKRGESNFFQTDKFNKNTFSMFGHIPPCSENFPSSIDPKEFRQAAERMKVYAKEYKKQKTIRKKTKPNKKKTKTKKKKTKKETARRIKKAIE